MEITKTPEGIRQGKNEYDNLALSLLLELDDKADQMEARVLTILKSQGR